MLDIVIPVVVIVKDRIDGHGSSVQVSSEAERGSVFSFQLKT